jgi:hypothetical protein
MSKLAFPAEAVPDRRACGPVASVESMGLRRFGPPRQRQAKTSGAIFSRISVALATIKATCSPRQACFPSRSGAYRRTDLLEQRRGLMEAWTPSCKSRTTGDAKVIELRKA